jgi:hypothetical protein
MEFARSIWPDWVTGIKNFKDRILFVKTIDKLMGSHRAHISLVKGRKSNLPWRSSNK